MIDYLTWRGDLPFSKDPFNSIDAALLSSLSYIDFTDVVPAKGMGKVTMREAARVFFKLHSEEELAKDKSFINFCPSILRALANSDRFKGAMLSNFVDDTDIGREIQFGALEIETSDGIAFISFRGTDDRIIGWKEDFNLSYMTVPAETGNGDLSVNDVRPANPLRGVARREAERKCKTKTGLGCGQASL